MPKPNFFIVGAPKCGTTAMYEYLRQHPDIFLPRYEKEPHYFATDFESRRFMRFVGQEQKYLSLFDDAQNERRIGEASVWYLYSKTAAQNIHAYVPDAKIIAMLRAPVEMLYSLYFDHIFAGYENIDSFEEALAAEPQRKAGQLLPKNLYLMVESLYYSEIVRYAEQVERYFDTFGRENVRVIIFDDFRSDTPSVYRDTLAFLGLDADFQADFRVHNSARAVRNRFVLGLLRNRYLIAAGDRVPFLARPVYTAVRALNTRRRPRPSLSPGLAERLKAQFMPEVKKLGALLGRNLSSWYTS